MAAPRPRHAKAALSRRSASGPVSVTAGLVSSGQLGGTLRFLSDHPEAGLSILALSMAATCGASCCRCSLLLACDS